MKKGSQEDGIVYHAGFPNAAEDDHTTAMSLDGLIVKNRASTYFWRLESGIDELQWRPGSIVVVDRALSPRSGRYIVIVVNDAFIIGRFGDKGFYALDGTLQDGDSQLWGVVTFVIQDLQ